MKNAKVEYLNESYNPKRAIKIPTAKENKKETK